MQRHIYLDYAATTPIDPRVWEAMSEVAAHDWGNPSSIHRYGRAAKKHVERARERVAELIGAQEDEIYFTSGGTEADNLAVIGTALRWLEDNDHGCIITTPIEHSAVLHACRQLERKTPIEVEYAQVDRQGVVSLETLQASTVKHGFLMSVMLANNEVGTIQPVQQLAEYARERGWIVHTDAVQAIGQIEVNVQQLGVDLLSLSAHKFYGPKGIGALYVRRGTRLYSMLQGGAQEKRLRPGTENEIGRAHV